MWGHFMVCCLCSIFYSGEALKGTRHLKAPLFSCTSPLIEQNYLWLLIFKKQGGSFWGVFLEFMMHLLKVFAPNYNCPLFDLKWKSYSREYKMKRCGSPHFLTGRGVLNVTTVSVWQHGNFDISVIWNSEREGDRQGQTKNIPHRMRLNIIHHNNSEYFMVVYGWKPVFATDINQILI